MLRMVLGIRAFKVNSSYLHRCNYAIEMFFEIPWTVPESKKEVQRFLSLDVGIKRRHNHMKIAASIHSQLEQTHSMKYIIRISLKSRQLES